MKCRSENDKSICRNDESPCRDMPCPTGEYQEICKFAERKPASLSIGELIDTLRNCAKDQGQTCLDCPHINDDSCSDVFKQAADLLEVHEKAKANRLLSLEEVQNLAYVDYEQQGILTAEYRPIGQNKFRIFRDCVVCHETLTQIGLLEIYDGANMRFSAKAMYGKYWRCWLRKPTRQETENHPWEGATTND